MNEDYEKQESTEELTTKIIGESTEIMNLLKKDGIKLEEVSNYHIYPIADNDTPMLSSDRLEYTLSNGLGATEKIWGLKEINDIYKNIDDLYRLSEKEVVEKIVQCNDENISNCSNIWKNATEINTSETLPLNKYFVSIEKTKVRYINPLLRNNNTYERIYNISEKAKVDIEKALN